MRREATILALAGLLAQAGVARADDNADCNGPDANPPAASLGVVAGGKVNFLASASAKTGCPSTSPVCKTRAFLLDDNTLVFGPATGGYVCATFIDGRGHETDGWLPAASVKAASKTPNWIGTWTRDTSAAITIKRGSDGKAELSGDASWGEGAGTNVGHIDAVIDPGQAAQSFATDGEKQMAYDKAGQYDCAVEMKQLGPYLVVGDNNNCGGANVNFSGVYTKR